MQVQYQLMACSWHSICPMHACVSGMCVNDNTHVFKVMSSGYVAVLCVVIVGAHCGGKALLLSCVCLTIACEQHRCDACFGGRRWASSCSAPANI